MSNKKFFTRKFGRLTEKTKKNEKKLKKGIDNVNKVCYIISVIRGDYKV